ncbi:uncharacterized protein MAM_04539 [Metarhizium album ARSEF 1941]|uniref:Uncharacterized protein n=1 Tax=Metarhizium album (strain ARSEF 1941) TaxID=1081103 RepID=A0A0B2WV54_METAS|nr:uncharacterized protein MAM_04539 [Metarhizium album ARSEF 1941]KHN97524.1 hypothetical protein MAM_04539 [Metarhizium album ARSEF 1941]
MPIKRESPPPASQSHFAKFACASFTPDDDAPFEHEFARLASSQQWISGSQEYTQERTIAMRQELMAHYFCDAPDTEAELTEQQKLAGYQALCREVGLPASASMADCKKSLRTTLVNIVDLIDARRTSREVKVWGDFDAFRRYTLQPEHRIDREEAKKNGGFLASLLQHLRCPRRGGARKHRRKPGLGSFCTLRGRIVKNSRA